MDGAQGEGEDSGEGGALDGGAGGGETLQEEAAQVSQQSTCMFEVNLDHILEKVFDELSGKCFLLKLCRNVGESGLTCN